MQVLPIPLSLSLKDLTLLVLIGLAALMKYGERRNNDKRETGDCFDYFFHIYPFVL